MSTKQTVMEYVTDSRGCEACMHHHDSGIFRLCRHESSAYRYDSKEDFHTVQHMREQHGLCGLDKKLFVAAA